MILPSELIIISIILPTYNRASTLKKTIESVLNQDYKHWELIIIDDGSIDNTYASIEDNLNNDERIHYFSQINQGVSVARNKGIEKSTGQYVVFLDSDDLVTASWLNDFVYLIKEGFEVGCCGVRIIRGSDITPYPPVRLSPLFHGFVGSFLAGSFIIKKDILKHIGCYDTKLTFSENSELGMRVTEFCAINKKQIGITNAINLTIVQDEDRTNRHSRNKLYSNIRILKKYKYLFLKNKKEHLTYLAIAGVEALRLGKRKTARILFAEGCKVEPYNMKNLSRFLITHNLFLSKFLYK